ncbi:MAG: hypothetical protein M1822_007910 [Bathelium mastoideum]|nr:MAG: hypothetical protein M1822_007910 [Bathelium mastoideum]
MGLLQLLRAPSTLLSTVAIILSYANPALSLPHSPEEADLAQAQNVTLERRCANPCGWTGQLCCASNQYCYTDSNNQAQCGDGSSGGGTTAAAGASGGYWQYYTSTWVETDTITVTSVYSSWYAGGAATTTAAAASASASCNWSLNESPCGPICCASGQYCLVSGQCAANSGGSSGYYTNTASAPLRPTSQGTGVATATVSPTTTVPFETPVATGANVTLTQSSSSGGLSGGAIAGIVIGVILGVILLALLCFYFCLDLLLGFFGLGGRRRRQRREEEVYVEEHRHTSHRGSGDRTWYRNRPQRIERTERIERRGPGWGGALGLGTMAAAIGFKGKRDQQRRQQREEKTEYSDSTASYSYDYTSASE